jgi:hypothetical protein
VFRLIAAGLCAAPLVVACDERITATQCEAMLDHYVAVLARSDGRKPSPEEVLRLQREARAKAAGDPEFQRCTREVSRKQLECALRAPSADDVERCLL